MGLVTSQKMKQTAIQKSARHQDCTLNIAGVCNYDPATTVLCHLGFKYGSGKRIRPGERNAVYACSACHEVMGSWNDLYGMEIARGIVRTTERRDELGI